MPRLIGDGEVEYLTDKAMRQIGEDAEIIFAAHALKKTGKMARNVKSNKAGDEVLVTVEARNPRDGFDYVGVTRFGHKQAFIRPDPRRAAASVISTMGARQTGDRARLRFAYQGRIVYAKRTRAFHPPSDWAQRAIPEVAASARMTLSRLGQTFKERWS